MVRTHRPPLKPFPRFFNFGLYFNYYVHKQVIKKNLKDWIPDQTRLNQRPNPKTRYRGSQMLGIR